MPKEAATMRVYQNGTPSHVQIYVGPTQACVDYLDADGELVYTVVHDAAAVERIAEEKGLGIEFKDMGGEPPVDLGRAAIERTHAESTGEDIPPDPQAEPEAVEEPEADPLDSASRDELYTRAQELDIDGRSSMDKDALLEAVKAAEAAEE